jgi:hypothetical protein
MHQYTKQGAYKLTLVSFIVEVVVGFKVKLKTHNSRGVRIVIWILKIPKDVSTIVKRISLDE